MTVKLELFEFLNNNDCLYSFEQMYFYTLTDRQK